MRLPGDPTTLGADTGATLPTLMRAYAEPGLPIAS
jgi:hypothetical protein